MANDMNTVAIIGRMTKNIDVKYTSNGAAIGNFTLAVNRTRKQGDQWIDEASFFDVKAFGKVVENLKDYMTKGKQVAVEGYLKQERWEKDGQKYSRVTIGAENIQLLGGNKNDGNSGNYDVGDSFDNPQGGQNYYG